MKATAVLGYAVVLMLAGCQQTPDHTDNAVAAQAQPVRAGDVADRLAKAGLPVTQITALTTQTDPDHLLGQPGEYSSKASFSDATQPKAGQSIIEVFATPADAMKRAEVVTSGAKDPAVVTQYQAVSGKVYLRLNEALPAAEANRYLKAFVALGL
ncbi:hypothetical protein SAMN05192583_1576 [Sphingomonas gellani]|uniref:Uncharacterized protein n=1 Tax=Sphingomonas gellani TaxID=1166340 RepID=A0A1H8CEY9_9SPHN|nr:hypothetical protein [Sphingomonas gellani]SEM93469.1 hypothetical protein SAMN05192583_1576 [Sphingomonas gellani]